MGVSQIKMPQLGESVTEGTVDKWLKHEGDFVKRDEPLVEVVTDKVNAEVPSPFEGTLVKISIGEGTTVPIGTEIAQMEVAGAAQEAEPAAQAAGDEAPAEAQPSVPAARSVAAETAAEAGPRRARLSPAVRRLAEEHGIDPTRLEGSGEGGRVTRDDVLAFLEEQEARPAEPAAPPPQPRPAPPQPAPAPALPVAVDGSREEVVKLSVMRRSI